MYLLKLELARTTEVGARRLVALATFGEESHRKDVTNSGVSEDAVSAFARSEESAQTGKKLWRDLQGMLGGIQKGVTEGLD